MDDHLTEEQIERYVNRRASVDELLATAQHLEKCWRCRDAAAALVDPGDSEVSHVRRSPESSGPVVVPHRSHAAIWIVVAVAVLIAIAVWWLRT